MFNVTGGELLIILLVALIVLGPDKLPEAVRKAGRLYGEAKRMANGFQSELRDAIDEPSSGFKDMKATFEDPLRSLRETAEQARSSFLSAADEPVIPPGGLIDQRGGTVSPGGPIDLSAGPVLPGEVVDGTPEALAGDHGLVELDDDGSESGFGHYDPSIDPNPAATEAPATEAPATDADRAEG